MNGDYMVLDTNNNRSHAYKTCYFDTSDYQFFMQHVRNLPERSKLRYRKYESTGTTYLEIKRKNSKNRTKKWRVESAYPEGNSFNDEALAFISKHIDLDHSGLKPVINNSFNRITFVGRNYDERVTIDYNLNFSDMSGVNISLPFLAIAEVKRDGSAGSSSVAGILKHLSVRPTGFSKYCVGSVLLQERPKSNTLKSKLLLIKKIENESHKSYDP
jgi:hypothetical protein